MNTPHRVCIFITSVFLHVNNENPAAVLYNTTDFLERIGDWVDVVEHQTNMATSYVSSSRGRAPAGPSLKVMLSATSGRLMARWSIVGSRSIPTTFFTYGAIIVAAFPIPQPISTTERDGSSNARMAIDVNFEPNKSCRNASQSRPTFLKTFGHQNAVEQEQR